MAYTQESMADSLPKAKRWDHGDNDIPGGLAPSQRSSYNSDAYSPNGSSHTLRSSLASSESLKDLEKGIKVTVEEVEHDPHATIVSGSNPPLALGLRLKHFTWAWYTLTMSTGGIATLISVQPHSFNGLKTIGALFYGLNLFFFVVICTLMLLRFVKYPSTLKNSLKHEREGLFFGPFWLSIATIITGTQRYVVQSYEEGHNMRTWLTTSIAIAFWAYTVCTFLVAVLQYSYLFNSLTYRLDKFMPSWLLPIFPIMLSGTIAAVIASDQPVASRYPILFAGLACQGLGFTVAVIMYAHYIGRLMFTGLPNREHRTAMYIGVGPPSFTALALIGMANAIPIELDLVQGIGFTIRVIAAVSAVALWMLALWFFWIATVAVILSPPKLFHLGWWAAVFPNSGFCIATIQIGNALQSEGLLYLGNAMTIVVVVTWMFVLFMNIRAVIVRDIMYPHMDEDVAD